MIKIFIANARNWSIGMFYAAFLLGAGGMVYLFQQWRRAADRTARNWLFAAFGSWVASVIVASGAQTPGYIVAGLSLAIALGGAIAVHLQRGRQG